MVGPFGKGSPICLLTTRPTREIAVPLVFRFRSLRAVFRTGRTFL